jgi:hypothetical protein
MRRAIGAIIVGCFLSVVAACSTQPNPCAGRGILPPTFALVYPIDRATSVPDSPQFIVVQQDRAATVSGVHLILTPPSGPSITVTPGPVPSPLPTPNTSPPPNALLVAFPVPALAPGTTYQVTFTGTITQIGGCPGPFDVSGMGSFTTQ